MVDDSKKLMLDILAKDNASMSLDKIRKSSSKLELDLRKLIGTFKALEENFKTLSQAVSGKNTGKFLQSQGINARVGSAVRQQQLFSGTIGAPSNDLRYLKDQIKAANMKYEAALAQLQVRQLNLKSQNGKFDSFSPKYKTMYQAEQNSVNRADAELKALEAHKERITREMREQNSLAKRNLTLDEQINKKNLEIQIAKKQGNNLDRIQQMVGKQQLVVDKARLNSAGQMTKEYERALSRLHQLKNVEKQVRIDTPRQVGRIDPASLFRVQADLLLNYSLMNQAFRLFDFGKQYVIEYESSLKNLQAVTQTSQKTMEGLSNTFLEVSNNTRFSAVEISNAALIMGQAGLSAQQINSSIKDTVLLATATGSDLATSVEIMTSSLAVFNITAEESGRVANVMTEALNLSKLTMDKVSLGMQYAGNIAAENGESLEDFVSILGAVANSGIKSGSTIATGLRQLYVSFQKPTKKMVEELARVGLTIEDVNVKTKGLIGVMDTLADAGFTNTQAMKSMELRGAALYTAFSRNLDAAKRFKQELLLSNAAAEANAIQMDSLESQMLRFRNVMGQSILGFAEPVSNALKTTLSSLSDLLGLLNQFPVVLNVLGTLLLNVFGAAVILRIGQAGTALLGLGTAFRTAAAGATVLRTVMTFFMGTPIGILIAGLTAVTAATALYSKVIDNSSEAMTESVAKMEEAKGAYDAKQEKVKALGGEIDRLVNRYGTLNSNSEALKDEVRALQIRFGEMDSGLYDFNGTVDDLIKKLMELQGEIIKTSSLDLGLQIKELGVQATLRLNNLRGSKPDPIAPYTAKTGMLPPSIISATNFRDDNYYNTFDYLKGLNVTDYKKAKPEDLKKATKALISLESYLTKKYSGILDTAQKMTAVGKEYPKLKEIEGSFKSEINNIRAFLSDINQTEIANDKDKQNRFETSKSFKDLNEKIVDAKKQVSLLRGSANRTALESKKAELDSLLSSVEKNDSEVVKRIAEESGITKAEVVNRLQLGLNRTLNETINDLGSNIDDSANEVAGSLTDFYDRFTEELTQELTEIERKINRSADATGRKVSKIDSRIAANDNIYSPAYKKYSDAEISIMEKNKFDLENQGLAEQLAMYKQQEALIDEIVKRQEAYYLSSKKAAGAALNASGDKGDDRSLRAYNKAMEDYNNALDKQAELKNKVADASARLTANLGLEEGANVSLGYQLRKILEEYATQAQIRGDFSKSIKTDVIGTLNQAEGAFADFLVATTDGTKSVSEAFGDMAVSVLKAMQRIAAEKLAAQLFGIALSAVVGAFSPGQIVYDSPIGPTPAGAFPGLNRGGTVRRYALGGSVPNRDSVPAILREGEYVLRNSAVQMIGRDNLDTINALGNRKISESGKNFKTSPFAETKAGKGENITNVYIMAPDAKPSLTKNDVIVTINDEITKNGSTIKLIKQVIR